MYCFSILKLLLVNEVIVLFHYIAEELCIQEQTAGDVQELVVVVA